jgi:hypothetical protein
VEYPHTGGYPGPWRNPENRHSVKVAAVEIALTMRAMRAVESLALVVAAGAVLAGAIQTPRQPTSTFRSGSTAVSVYATVSDDTHRLVPKLTADDFLVFDDGELQEITLFDRSAVPITAVVLLDASESMRTTVPLLRAAAAEFVERLRKEDQAELGTFNNTIRFARPFTGDHERLFETLRYFGAIDYGIWTVDPHSGTEPSTPTHLTSLPLLQRVTIEQLPFRRSRVQGR